eukprot:TRINITY_DN2905_c0_g1_i3.p2 TRINITY_DN2905_c0_g1~~TRINITY_DN2905_c0_g1_i3.p2  ORF type:complete len:110 (+),score=15.82 TRINITY_DN2905_c0_g1_i3:58-387(+)
MRSSSSKPYSVDNVRSGSDDKCLLVHDFDISRLRSDHQYQFGKRVAPSDHRRNAENPENSSRALEKIPPPPATPLGVSESILGDDFNNCSYARLNLSWDVLLQVAKRNS